MYRRFPWGRIVGWLVFIGFVTAWGVSPRGESAELGRIIRVRQPEVMSGDFSGVVVTLFLDKELVQSWLPDGLLLAPQTPFPQHPVIVLFGTQEHIARTKRITVYPRYAQSYLETFVAVPYLKFASRPDGAPVFHFARVYLNNWKAMAKGAKRYGWPKVYADVESSRGFYRIGGGKGTVFDAETGPPESPLLSSTNTSLRTIKDMLSQPLVLKREGILEVSAFDFHFNSAVIRPTSAELEIKEGFMPGLTPRTLTVYSITDEPYGAFYMESHFTRVPMAY